MTKEQNYDILQYMWLEKRLVGILDKISYKSAYTRNSFVAYILKEEPWIRIRIRINYFCKKDRFSPLIDNAIKDCITHKYIDYDSTTDVILVNTKGRQFITFSGYCEEYFKRHRRFSTATISIIASGISGLVGVVIGALLVYFLNK